MPGIFGLITKMPEQWAKRQLARMVDALFHEPFYVEGSKCDASLGVYVGWVARAGSFPDGMPVENERADKVLVFSGEEYSDPGVVHHLEQNGRTSCAQRGAYLIQLADRDSSFPKSLNGMFHGLLTDRTRGTAALFNDRYGMHRLYYHEAADGFFFASEAKAILAVRPELRTSDPRSMGEFVACSCVLENRTIFKDIHVLPGASEWTFKNGELVSKRTYFEPREWENQPPLDSQSYYQGLRSVLKMTLPRYFGGRERLGIAMTGGLDTRTILALHPPAPGSLPGYTFGGSYRDSYDVRIGRQIAAILQQPHQVIEVGKEFLNEFAGYAERSILISEGTVDVYRASDLYVSRKARQIAPVKIVGTYGSEIVRHAVMFKPVPTMPGLFSPEFLPHLDEATYTYVALRRQNPVTFAAFNQSPWYHYGILAIEQSQLTVRSPFLDNEFVRTVYRAPQDTPSDEDIRLRLIRDGNPALAVIASDRGVVDKRGFLSALRRASREFTFKAEYAYDYGMPPLAARVDHFFSGLRLERMFLGRHKLTHFRVWYRDQLAQYVREILLDSRTLGRPYLQKKAIEAIVEGHLHGGRNYTTAIHKLLTLELLHRLFFDAN